jgi:hypothetical protein
MSIDRQLVVDYGVSIAIRVVIVVVLFMFGRTITRV